MSDNRYLEEQVIQLNIDIDTVKSYIIYFPHNNLENVLKGYAIYRKGLQGYIKIVQMKMLVKKTFKKNNKVGVNFGKSYFNPKTI